LYPVLNCTGAYNIAIGTSKNPSPIGLFRIIEKGDWGTYEIHGTTKPPSIGRTAFHGRIRMRNKDAAELYSMVKHGTIVEIYGGPFGKGFRELHPGDTGADVMEVQRYLKLMGYYKGYLGGYMVSIRKRL